MTPTTSIATIGIYVGTLFYSTIQNNQDIENKVSNCGGSTLPEGYMPDCITDRFPAASVLNPIREIHCVRADGIRFPIQSQAVLNDRYIFTLGKDKNARVSTELIKALAHNDHLDHVQVDFTEFSDSHLKTLSASEYILQLGICGTKCTDAGMKHLRKYRHLESVYLCELPIRDTGAAEIAKCKSLKYVNIYETSIGPKGLEKLFELPNLETLVVSDDPRLKKALSELKKKRAKVKVVEFKSETDAEGNKRVAESPLSVFRNQSRSGRGRD